MMLSVLELRHLIESAFLPVRCCCRVESQGYIKIEIFDSDTGMQQLLVTGIAVSDLTGNQAITNLISEIREELQLPRNMQFSTTEK